MQRVLLPRAARRTAATASRPAKATGPTGRRQRPGCLELRRVVPPGTKMQVHPAALPLDLIDLALAVVLTPGLERKELGVPRNAWRAVTKSRTVMRPG